MAYPLFRKDPWYMQPQEPVRIRPELFPIAGINPGAFGRDEYLVDTSGQALTLNPVKPTRAVSEKGVLLDFPNDPNTGIYRPVTITDHPLSVVIVGSCDAGACVTSIASTGDKTCRIFVTGLGTLQAQHIGATTNALATTGQSWTFGNWFICVASFESPVLVNIYSRGNFAYAAAGTNSANVGALGAMTRASFGIYDGSTRVSQFDGRLALVQWLRKAINAREAHEILTNPWVIFEPIKRPLMIMAAAPTTPVLSAATVTNITDTTVTPQVTITF